MVVNKWWRVVTVVSVALCLGLGTLAYGEQISNQGEPEPIPDGQPHGGVISAGLGPATGSGGDVVYTNLVESGSFFRPLPGYRAYDDIHLEPGGSGALLEYSVRVFGSTVLGSQAGSPYDVRIRLYESATGQPGTGFPLPTYIPGTECIFVAIPAGASFTLSCKVTLAVTIPDVLFLALDFSTDNAGWLMAGGLGTIGSTLDFFFVEDFVSFPGSFAIPNIGCPTCSAMVAEIIVEGQPWGCCDMATLGCTNIQETKCDPATSSFAQGTLCNDLDPPCSAAGACCDIATGQCQVSFEIDCGGFLERFSEGETCQNVDCQTPDNVPAVTHWGRIVLTLLFLTGLTINSARRRSITT